MPKSQGCTFIPAFAFALTMILFGSCSKASAPPAPKKPDAASKQGNVNSDITGKGDKPSTDSGQETSTLSIRMESGGSTIKGKKGSTLTEKFEISGVNSDSDVYLALAEMPSGLRISGRDSLNPSISWRSPKSGKHQLKFLLRDAKACIEEEGSAEDCRLDSGDDDKKSSGKSYDSLSSNFTIDIKSSSDSGGNGGDSGGSSGSKGQLIQTIIGLAGGLFGGGGLGGGGGGLGSLLQGMSGGQLQGLLGGLQNGGGGAGGLGSLLGGLNNNGNINNGGYDLVGSNSIDWDQVCTDVENHLAAGEFFDTYAEMETYVRECRYSDAD